MSPSQILPSDFIERIKTETAEAMRKRDERRRALWNRDIAREVRILAWIDLLGFSNELLRAQNDAQYLAVYRKMLRVHEEFGHPHADGEPNERRRINKDYGRTVLALSDGILVTASPKAKVRSIMPPYEFFMDFIQDIQWAQANCAVAGIFLRGGISIGHYYYKDDILLSPALIRAYRLETQRACYPAIIIDARDMAQIVALSGRENFGFSDEMVLPFKSPAQRKGERFYFIDYLDYLRHPDNHGWFSDEDRKAHLRTRDPKLRNRIFTNSHRKEAARFMKLHKDHILKAYREAPLEKVKAKYRWLAKYHNRSLRGFPRSFDSALVDPAAFT